MKKTLLFLFIALSLKMAAQDTIFIGTGCSGCYPDMKTFGFEDNSEKPTFYIDTTLPGNLWQIGKPIKTVFSSADFSERAMVTDTVHPYTINNRSSFYIVVQFFDLYDFSISFRHRMDADSLQDGGMIEMSRDSGATWANVLNFNWRSKYGLYDSSSYISSLGQAGFTGSFPWKDVDFRHLELESFTPFATYIFKFTFASDSSQVGPRDGWMIDNLRVVAILESVNENRDNDRVSVYPNPVEKSFQIQSSTSYADPFLISIYDYLGEKVKDVTGSYSSTIDVSDLHAGIYFVSFVNKKTRFTKKNVVR